MDWISAITEWKYFRKEVRIQWMKLSELQLDAIAGERALLADELRTSYGLTAEQAEGQICRFEAKNAYLRATSSR